MIHAHDMHVLVQWICHNYNDESCLKILKKCHEALPEIVTVSNHSDYPDASTATKFAGGGYLGRERTAKEFEALAKGAGFQGFQVKCCAYGTYIMEFYKTA
ncbi:hypothetical protein GQ457_16G027350 [Hibiscus cannabinus]